MGSKSVTYKYVLCQQREFLRMKKAANNIYKLPSTLFTYIFIKLNVSANTVTLLTYLLCILGFIFLSLGTYLSIAIGSFFFMLFYLFDASDGDLARIRKEQSLEGLFFDEISHFIEAICFGFGIGIGMHKLYQNDIYLLLGFIAAIALILEHSIGSIIKSVLRRGIIDSKIKNQTDHNIQRSFNNFVNKGEDWSEGNFISKIIGIYPVQGLLYSIYFIYPVIIAIAIAELYLISIGLNFGIYGLTFGLIPIYLLIMSLVKLNWAILSYHKMNRDRHITSFLKNIKVLRK